MSDGSVSQLGFDFSQERSQAALLREISTVGGRFERVVLTRNRRLMASVSDGGRTLRVHESFRRAPSETLHALGKLLSSRNLQVRERARATVRAYLEAAFSPAGTPARPRRPSPPSPADIPHIQRLQAEFDLVNQSHFDAALPRLHIRLSARMRRRLGHFCSDPLEIAISRTLCEKGEAGEAEETLRHEMIHLWQWHTGARAGHGADFRGWARQLGITPRATRGVRWAADLPFACR